jgi:hypothetical protein
MSFKSIQDCAEQTSAVDSLYRIATALELIEQHLRKLEDGLEGIVEALLCPQ